MAVSKYPPCLLPLKYKKKNIENSYFVASKVQSFFML